MYGHKQIWFLKRLTLSGRKEGNVLFNDTLNTFWLSTSQIAREETYFHHYMSYSFRLAARVLLYAISHRQNSTALVTPVVENWLERKIAQWVNHEGSIRWLIAWWINTLTTELHLAQPFLVTGAYLYMMIMFRLTPPPKKKHNKKNTLAFPPFTFFNSSQYATTGVTKAVVCTLLSVRWCI